MSYARFKLTRHTEMTAFNSTNVPSEVNTLERLIVLACMGHKHANPQRTIEEELNFISPVAPYDIKFTPSGDMIFTARAIILLDRSLYESGNKLWKCAKEHVGGLSSLPPAFTTN